MTEIVVCYYILGAILYIEVMSMTSHKNTLFAISVKSEEELFDSLRKQKVNEPFFNSCKEAAFFVTKNNENRNKEQKKCK